MVHKVHGMQGCVVTTSFRATVRRRRDNNIIEGRNNSLINNNYYVSSPQQSSVRRAGQPNGYRFFAVLFLMEWQAYRASRPIATVKIHFRAALGFCT